MNIVLFLSGPVNLDPFYKNPIPVELFDTDSPRLYDKNHAAWNKYFPGARFFVIDSSGSRVFSELCGNSDSLNIPSTGVFTKTFIFSAFSCAFSLSPISVFSPAYLDPAALPGLCGKVADIMSIPITSESLTFFSSMEKHDQVSIELGDPIFKTGDNEIFSIRGFVPFRENRDRGFLAMSPVFAMNSFHFKDFLSRTSDSLYGLFLSLEKCWKDPSSLKTFFSDAIPGLDSLQFDREISKMEEKFAVGMTSMPREIDSIYKLLGTLAMDGSGNHLEGDIVISGVYDSLIINRSGKKLILKNLRDSFILASEGGMRVETAVR
jgi:hypothetical protein